MTKEKKRKYAQIYEDLWRTTLTPLVKQYTPLTALFYVYLLSCQHRNLSGIYRLPIAYMGSDLNLREDQILLLIDELIAEELIAYDFDTEEVYVKHFILTQVGPVRLGSEDNRATAIEFLLYDVSSEWLYDLFNKDYNWEGA